MGHRSNFVLIKTWTKGAPEDTTTLKFLANSLLDKVPAGCTDLTAVSASIEASIKAADSRPSQHESHSAKPKGPKADGKDIPDAGRLSLAELMGVTEDIASSLAGRSAK